MAALRRALRERDVSHFDDMPIAFNATPFHPALAALPLTTLAVKGSDERLTVTNLDGHHRLFIMKLLDIESCSMMTIWDPEWLGADPSREKRSQLRDAHVPASRGDRGRRPGVDRAAAGRGLGRLLRRHRPELGYHLGPVP